MALLLLTLIPAVIDRLIVDTQTQISEMLAFSNEQKDISIWFRAQPSFMEEMPYDPPVIFAFINDNDGNTIFTFSYMLLEKELDIYLDDENERREICQHIFDTDEIDFTWIRLLLHKSIEKLEYVQINDKKVIIQSLNSNQINMLYSWQSKQFSCNIHDSIQSISEKVLMLQNDVFLISQALNINNFRQQIIFIIYAKYQQTKGDFMFMKIQDYKWQILLAFNQTDVMAVFNYGYYKSFIKTFDQNMTNEWFSITIQYEIDKIKCQMAFQEKIFEQNVYYKFDDNNQIVNQNLFLPIEFVISKFIQNYQIFVINKYEEFQIVNLDELCFQNCKICKKLQCLECEGKLSLLSNCLCPINQVIDSYLGVCVDKTETKNIKVNYNFDLNFCPFGQYQNEITRKCAQCPKINQYYCSSCLYNTHDWQTKQTCEFQDIFQQAFILFHTSIFVYIDKDRGVNLETNFDDNYQIKLLDDNRYLILYKDIYLIMLGMCEQNYFFDKNFYKCSILQQGQQYGYFEANQYKRLCKIGYINLNKCIKCQKNCLFCKFIKQKLVCLLPAQSYTLNQNQQVIKCQEEQCLQITEQYREECSIENCLVCYYASCLICDSKYIQDPDEFCVIGSKYSNFFTLQINDNLVKPQFDQQQIFYLKNQLENARLELNYDDIIQLIIFGNNYKAMRQDQLPQQQKNKYYDEPEQIYCLNQTQYFQYKFCHLHVPEYQYIQQLDNYVYCPNKTCVYDLIYEVVVYFTNKPSIQYKNMIFLDFQHFIESLQINDLFIKNIIIKANVYVFETPQKDCSFPYFFATYNQTKYQYQLILDFQGVSVFADCKSSIRIDFDEVSILNLYTHSTIKLQIKSDKIIMRNCSFKVQENLLLNLQARKIYLEQIYIQGILQNQIIPIFNITYQELIDDILINYLYVEKISLIGQKMIKIWKKVTQIQIKNITLIDSEFKEQSSMIGFQETINLRIESLIIENMIFEKSGVILLLPQEQNYLTLNNAVLKNSSLSKYSALFQSNTLNIQNILFINMDMKSSRLMFATQNLTIQNMSISHLNTIESLIVYFQGKFIKINKFQIVNSSIINTDTLLDVQTEQFSMKFIQLSKCSYFPNIRLMNIYGRIGIITYLVISKITYGTEFQQNHMGDNYESDMIIINAKKIRIQYVHFVDLVNIQQLINIKYDQLQINYLYLKNFQFHKMTKYQQQNLIKYIIQIQSQKEDSLCLIQNFKATTLFTRHIQNSHREKFGRLTLINLLGGYIKINQFYIYNLLSQQQIYIINAFQLKMIMENIILDDLQNIGILQFSSSQVYCRDIYYNTNHLYQIIVPLFKSDDLLSKNNIITIKDFQLISLRTSLIEIKSNFSFKIQLINLKIQLINLQDDIINIQLSDSVLGYLSIFKMKIINYQYENQEQFYVISGNNLNTRLQFIQLRNFNIGVFSCVNNQQFYGKNIYVLNGTIVQNLFQFFNFSGAASIINLIIYNITQSYAIIYFNFTNQINYKPTIIVENILIYQYQGEYFINYVQKNQNQVYIALKNVRIDQCYFNNSILQFQNLQPILFDINGLFITKVKCALFLATRQNDIIIKNSIIIDLYCFESIGVQEIHFISSDLYQTNILYKQTDSQNSNEYLEKSLSIQDVYPIQLSFYGTQAFKLLKREQVFKVQFNQDNKIAYVPSGQQLNKFQYFNHQSMDHEQMYDSFSIIINSKTFRQTEQILCGLKQSLDGAKVGKYSNYQWFSLSNGLNTFDDFMFIMNPYTNYSFLQNDIICNNYTLSFNVKILPCQLGEYLYQNKCITCDTNKNLYSIIRKAQYCQIINPEQISELRVGRIKLQQNYWKPSLTSNLIEKCEIDQVCLGGWLNGDQSCNSSRVGALCKECDIYNTKGEGQFVQSGQKCLECKPNLLLLLKGFCIFLWIIFITFMNYNTNKKITEKFLQFKIMNRVYSDILMRQSIDQFSIIIKIYTNYIFIMYLVQENLQFLNDEILLVLNFISNPGIIITTELDCILVNLIDIDIQYLQLAQSLIQPILILSLVYFIYVALIALKVQKYHFNLIIIITYSVYLFNQQIIIQNQIKLLSYKMISGIKWIYSNQQFQFFTQKHLHMIATFIAPTTLIILVIPILIFFLLKFRDKQSIWCIKKYGIIYCDYKHNAYFQEIIRIYTQHIIIFLLYFLNYVDQSILIIFLIVKLYFYEQYQPYALNNLNRLEKNTYLLSIFSLISIFQLIKQIPTITYTILAIVNIVFVYKITTQLKICFKRQYRNLIQLLAGKLQEKFSILKRFQLNQLEMSQQSLQKFKLSVSKLQNKSKTSKTYSQLQLQSYDQQNLIKIGGEIELQSVQIISPFQEQK
ncbi:hypothetical protein pb186bvf_008165 [Paramecium bursaria]